MRRRVEPGRRRTAARPHRAAHSSRCSPGYGKSLYDLASRAASGADPQADAIITALRLAAGRDEHETSLGEPLRKADSDALELMMARTRPKSVRVEERTGLTLDR